MLVYIVITKWFFLFSQRPWAPDRLMGGTKKYINLGKRRRENQTKWSPAGVENLMS